MAPHAPIGHAWANLFPAPSSARTIRVLSLFQVTCQGSRGKRHLIQPLLAQRRKMEPRERNNFAKGSGVAQCRIIWLSGLLTSTPALFTQRPPHTLPDLYVGHLLSRHLLSPCTFQAGTELVTGGTPLSKEQAVFSRTAQEDAESFLCAGLFRSIKEQHLDQLEGPRKAFLRSWSLRLS